MSPTEEIYRSKSNAELKEILETLELGTPKAKNPFKPNKDEMVQALMAYKRQQDRINGIEPEEGDIDPEEENESNESAEEYRTPITGSAQTKSTKVALLRADLMRKERVIIHDTQQSQTGFPNLTVAWGNRLIGSHVDIVYFGKPWYVRRGALNNLESAEITEYEQGENGHPAPVTRKRFLITNVEGWTDEELELKRADQMLRNSRGGSY